MSRPNYTIIRCQTTDKERVMDLLCDANEYQLARGHVDAVYENGNTAEEKRDTKRLVRSNIAKLIKNGIQADSKPDFLDDWLFIQLH